MITLCSSPTLPGESLPPACPDLPGLRGADPVWPPLLLLPSVPLCPTVSLWGSFPKNVLFNKEKQNNKLQNKYLTIK